MPAFLEAGYRIGKYQIAAHIATGGMGAVYKALDLELGRTVALKVLSSELSKNELVRERFRREARHAARLSHAHIVTIYECGHDAEGDHYYLALEYIDGIDLGRYLNRRGRLTPAETRRILMQTAKALDHAHEQGIVHRDIKPSNILLAKVAGKTVVKVADLGLARAADEDEYRVTREGSTVGTIDYMSPEQARDSASTDIRSDIYSLGCTAFHMLTGRPPFAQGGLGERLFGHLETPAPDVRTTSPDVSLGLSAIVAKMLAKKPADRFATPGELIRSLKRTPADHGDEDQETAVFDHGGGRITVVDPSPQSSQISTTSAPTPHQATPLTPLVTLDQARTAAAYHDKAVQVLADPAGDASYARQLVTNALKLDPLNTTYRKSLREVNRRTAPGALGRWLGSINVLAIRSRMKLARTNSDWRAVLDHGEELLAHAPTDADVHLEMAEAAGKLDVAPLAVWLLEEGLAQAPDPMPIIRALAHLHEELGNAKAAIALWQRALDAKPGDQEAHRQMNALLVREHLAAGMHRK